MARQRMFLVVRSDRTCRVVKKPRIAADEVAIPLELVFPDTWGTVLNERITLTVPDFVPEVVHHQEA
jgi:hypothetical protein